ncbi:P-loop containing nucleoside triphosphate hydrolase protein [Phycomyces blakesleeanus]|uniref:RNA helicase n=1 Tax=Phycomyces blakesleeanus TaxID=4837 RepID=A0ABR3AQY1_PHYBL
MASHRSNSRHRSPSPSSKRQKQSHYNRPSSRSRSRDRSDRSDRHRHRSSSTRYSTSSSSGRSSRYDDRPSHRDSHRTSSRHRDNVSTSDSRSQSTSTPTTASPAQETKPQVDKEELARKRRERIEQWKQKEALKKAEQQAKAAEEQALQKIKDDAADQERKEIQAELDRQQELLDKEAKEEREKQEEIEKEQQQQREQEMELLRKQRQANAKLKKERQQKEKQEGESDDSNADDSNKGWNLEDEDEDEDELMENPAIEEEREAAERSFKPLHRQDEHDEATMDLLAGKPRNQNSVFSDPTPKPKNTMRIGLGLGKNMMMKKAVQEPKPMVIDVKKPKQSLDKDVAMGGAEEVDPLEAYMMDVTAEARKINEEDKKRLQEIGKSENKRTNEEDEADFEPSAAAEEDMGSDPEDILALAAKKVKRKDLAPVDHSQMEYEPFRKNFYIEPPELKEMTSDQVDMLRIELDGIKIRGVNCPKPVLKWTHCGLPAGCLEVIRKLKFDKPTSIQAQAVPAIMNGRDVIGVAKTGSGKTIAFLLPMFRHIKDQRPLEIGEGPIAIIMTPTRELATQIHRECKPFLKVLGLRAVCAYGGSPIKDQIADLKRGCEIIVCTPGRMIDLLCANSGRVTNLRRVTYMVLDEADRMFDMGFEPQVMKIVNNVRPGRQTVLFSATFPRQMEALARKVLKKPLEITVGGRSVVCDDVEQIVEVREDSTKFIRLLEIFGQFFNTEETEDSRALIFVDRQEAADNLLRDLIRRGYLCQSLHGGKDQADRDSTIADFKSGVCNILIATSVAARGLDVKQLKLVVNYECPNHMEDYVHRVGRTGRAGNKGTAYTFITPDQERYAVDILKALRLSGQSIPPDVQMLADRFQEKVHTGKERMASSGFGGKGLERFDKDRDMVKKIQKKAYGGDDLEESDEEDIELETRVVSNGGSGSNNIGLGKKDDSGHMSNVPNIPGQAAAAAAAAAANAAEQGKGSNEQLSAAALAAKRAATEVAARINAMVGSKSRTAHDDEGNPVYAEEIVINDYPQKARWRVTNKEQISQITEISGAAITTRGTFFPPGKQPGPGDRKLYLFIEGDSETVVDRAKNEIKRILIEATVAQMEAEARTGGGTAGRYSVV